MPPRKRKTASADPKPATPQDSSRVDRFGVRGLEQQSVAPSSVSGAKVGRPPLPDLGSGQFRELIGWLHETMAALAATVGSASFLDDAARALVQVVGLDTGRVLLREGDTWSVAAVHGCPCDCAWQPSEHVLGRLCQEKRALVQQSAQALDDLSAGLSSPAGVLAAPILDAQDRVIGVLYGEQCADGPATPRALESSDALLKTLLVDMLAFGISTGLERQDQEKAAVRHATLFEQFFSPALARQLATEPELLKGAEREVTLLFCDVRGFSGFSEKLGPEKTVEWINDVMGHLSECVLLEEGVVVDYIGDALFAMWGAPMVQADQAQRAVRAALAMIDRLPELNRQWESLLGGRMSFGVGINTGRARVGNTGSRFKFKYGPLGNAVNLAARVEGLTKYLKSKLLVTAATRQGLGDSFLARRVVKVRVVNIREPVDLFEVERIGDPERAEFFEASEAALDALEEADFPDAARRASALLTEYPGDGPLLLILARAVEALMIAGLNFDPVWSPPGK